MIWFWVKTNIYRKFRWNLRLCVKNFAPYLQRIALNNLLRVLKSETVYEPKGILLGGIAPRNNNINSSRRIQRLTSPINNDRPQLARRIKLNVTVNGLPAPWSSSEFLSVPVLYVAGARAHALSNDVNILIMRNPPVITVYFNTTIEQTIKSDGAARPEWQTKTHIFK